MAWTTLAEWLSERPAALSRSLEDRLAAILSAHETEDLPTAARSCVDAATTILHRLTIESQPGRSTPSKARATAVDLLLADALITIACELAAYDCNDIDERAGDWASRIASRSAGGDGTPTGRPG
ncbi:MAG TPA: hypothetical protein VIF83_10470 [Gemmatimonadaceae bacterium]